MKNEFYGIDFSDIRRSQAAMPPMQPIEPMRPVQPTLPMQPTPSEQPMVVGMAYVLMQPFDTIYEPMQAFDQGTLFPDLDKPFHPGGMRHG